METVKLRDVLRRCADAHGLVDGVGSVEEASARAAGIYGATPTSYLGMAVRVQGFQSSMLEESLYERRSLVRIPAMRGSVYLLPRELVPSGLALAGASGASRWLLPTVQGAGLSESGTGPVIASIESLLRQGPKTSSELRKGLRGWREPAPGTFPLLIRHLCTTGRIVATRARGTWKSQLHEYALLSDWIGSPSRQPTVEKALDRLTPFYFAANGPATASDFAWWAGVKEEAAKTAIQRANLVPVLIDRLQGIHFATPKSLDDLSSERRGGSLRLLPHWDAYVMAHRDRRRYLDPRWREHVVDQGGNVTSVVLEEGKIAGVWGVRHGVLRFAPFEPVRVQRVKEALGLLGEFLEVRDLTEMKPPGPLQERGQNAFLNPIP